ncbi:unnamed protein product [Mytilus edulis]|uniref:Uncharacterized protein n=1 Tax=Mytilus edulis TaxID=6550 RepID=A0A8S3TTP1_MYTED|nr:unnamed protein product [Mytilus edulis]
MSVENADTALQSSKHSVSSSDNDTNTAEIYDDAYEKPYKTLMVHHSADHEHVYRNTNTFYENATPVEKAYQTATDCKDTSEFHNRTELSVPVQKATTDTTEFYTQAQISVPVPDVTVGTNELYTEECHKTTQISVPVQMATTGTKESYTHAQIPEPVQRLLLVHKTSTHKLK